MNIGLVIQGLNPAAGGAEMWTWQFSQHLLAAGHEVHVVAAEFAPEVVASRIVTHHLRPARSRTAFAEAAAERLGQLRLDVVHDMGAGWYCDVFQPHGGSRMAAFEHNLLLVPPTLRPLKRGLAHLLPRYREFDRLTRRQFAADGRTFIALSRRVARHFVDYHNVPPENVRVIYNGVDTERFTPEDRFRHRDAMRQKLGVSEDEVLILIVAHNFRLKGVPTLLKAVAQLRRAGEPVRLAVVGGKRLTRYARQAVAEGAGDAVQFVGSVADTRPFYAAADVYAQPTFYDPCSLVVLEALASGLPVVTSRFNGVSELLTPGQEGEVVDDPADAEELVACLTPMLTTEKRQEMGNAARRLAVARSFERNVKEIVAVYETLLDRRQAA